MIKKNENLLSRDLKTNCRFQPYSLCKLFFIRKSENVGSGSEARKKATLTYATLSILDRNLFDSTGKHIGTSKFYIDPETERMIRNNRPGESKLSGILSEVRIVDSDPANLKFAYNIDPDYLPIHSHESILIQIADLVAYFVGKHLSLSHQITANFNISGKIDDSLAKKINDSNFAYAIWQLLDIEEVLGKASS